jgi:hypothetical protein
MHRAFVHFAPVRIRDRAAQHDRSYGRKRERHDEEKRQHIPRPWKSFGLPFMTAIPNHRLRVNILARVFKSLIY